MTIEPNTPPGPRRRLETVLVPCLVALTALGVYARLRPGDLHVDECNTLKFIVTGSGHGAETDVPVAVARVLVAPLGAIDPAQADLVLTVVSLIFALAALTALARFASRRLPGAWFLLPVGLLVVSRPLAHQAAGPRLVYAVSLAFTTVAIFGLADFVRDGSRGALLRFLLGGVLGLLAHRVTAPLVPAGVLVMLVLLRGRTFRLLLRPEVLVLGALWVLSALLVFVWWPHLAAGEHVKVRLGIGDVIQTATAVSDYMPLAGGLVLVGVVAGLRQSRADRALALFLALYVGAILVSLGIKQVRHFVHVVPVLALFAAIGVRTLLRERRALWVVLLLAGTLLEIGAVEAVSLRDRPGEVPGRVAHRVELGYGWSRPHRLVDLQRSVRESGVRYSAWVSDYRPLCWYYLGERGRTLRLAEDAPVEEAERAIAEARREAGPDGLLVAMLDFGERFGTAAVAKALRGRARLIHEDPEKPIRVWYLPPGIR